MMNILIITATEEEIKLLKKKYSIIKKKHTLTFLHTGVGMSLTAYAVTKELLKKKYDLVINAGIAGSFSKKINIGELVAVQSDVFAELGAEDDAQFIKFPELNLPGYYLFQKTKLISKPYYNSLKKVKAATVNKVHGNTTSIKTFLNIHDVTIESMEGAAVAMVCELEKTPYIQIRSISNYVTKRNKKEWDIALAVKNLNEGLQKILDELDE